MHTQGRIRRTALVAVLLAAVGCGGSDSSSNTGLGRYLTQVASGNLTATLHTGTPPAGSGPVVTLDSSGITIPGGSKQITVNSATSFTAVAVMVQGVDGYYELTGLPPGTTTLLVVTFAQALPNTFSLQVSSGSGAGFGTAAPLPVTVTSVGTGDVQVNVSWDVDSDVDLHVIDPTGEEIYYGNSSARSTGVLDLDSNAGCSLDHKRSENITWAAGKAPRGTYTVRVDYWSACSVSKTNYVVTANVAGQATRVQNGSFTGSGDSGGAGSGTLIWTFTY